MRISFEQKAYNCLSLTLTHYGSCGKAALIRTCQYPHVRSKLADLGECGAVVYLNLILCSAAANKLTRYLAISTCLCMQDQGSPEHTEQIQETRWPGDLGRRSTIALEVRRNACTMKPPHSPKGRRDTPHSSASRALVLRGAPDMTLVTFLINALLPTIHLSVPQ